MGSPDVRMASGRRSGAMIVYGITTAGIGCERSPAFRVSAMTPMIVTSGARCVSASVARWGFLQHGKAQ